MVSIVSLLVFGLGLTGCAPEPNNVEVENLSESGAQPSDDTQEAGELPEPVVEETAVEFVLPSNCAGVLPLSLGASFDSRIEVSDATSTSIPYLESFLGPRTWETLQRSDDAVYCAGGIPQSDGVFALGAAVISASDKSDLLAALRDSVFQEQQDTEAEAWFIRDRVAGHPYLEQVIFDGDLLIAVGQTVGGDFGQLALSSIRDAQ